MGVDIAGLVGVFICGTRSREREQIEKAQLMTARLAGARGHADRAATQG